MSDVTKAMHHGSDGNPDENDIEMYALGSDIKSHPHGCDRNDIRIKDIKSHSYGNAISGAKALCIMP